MSKRTPIIVFGIILVAVIITAASIVASSYSKNKKLVPDATNKSSLNEKSIDNIKSEYETEKAKQDFLKQYEEIELAVANKFLDGSVVNEQQFKEKVELINKIFKTDSWEYLGLDYPKYWMGTWSVDSTGKLEFTFREEVKPTWVSSLEIKDCIK